MDKLEKTVLKTIDRHKMIKEGCTVIAAVSGGFDSVCMLSALLRLKRLRKFTLCVAHLNHSFRHDSDDDEKYVIDLCEKWGIKIYTKKMNVEKYASLNKISFETAGRNVRYEFLNSLTGSIPNSVIATGHNANDNAESIIMHLLRGCGLGGLTGIKAVRGNIIRPLIEVKRSDIERYCEKNQLLPRTDYTNFDDIYTRNDIRLNVMPHIAKRGGVEAIIKTSNLLSVDEDFLCKHTKLVFKSYVAVNKNTLTIKISDFNLLHLSIKRRLLKYILQKSDKEIGLVHIDSIISIAQKNYGGKRVPLPGGSFAAVEKGNLIIVTKGAYI
ncbi:MAG: tRNA lysidine(34) synthetase TilS [Firmicutes bacterium]|nr:tRNA lysidine(34) synthetase TilS [Bacillota bacterium]